MDRVYNGAVRLGTFKIHQGQCDVEAMLHDAEMLPEFPAAKPMLPEYEGKIFVRRSQLDAAIPGFSGLFETIIKIDYLGYLIFDDGRDGDFTPVR